MSQITSEDISLHSFSSVASRWLVWQCKMISDVRISAVFLQNEQDDDVLEMVAKWSSESSWESMDTKLYELARDVVSGRKSMVSKLTCTLDGSAMVCDTITLPVHKNNEVIGAVVFLQAVRSEEQKKAVLQLFQWGVTWLESTLEASSGEMGDVNPFIHSMIEIGLEDEPMALTAYHISNFFAEYFHCTRVGLGEVDGLNVHILGLSHQLRFDAGTSMVRDMELTMEEASDQKQSIIYPKVDGVLSDVILKHQRLSGLNEDASIVTIPLKKEGTVFATFLLMRSKNKPFRSDEYKVLQRSSELLSSVLAFKLKEEDTLFTKVFQNIKQKLRWVFGKGHFRFKLLLASILILFITLLIVKIPYFIYGKSSLEGAIQQVIVAPYDGFIEKANVRAGGNVDAGEVMVQLADHDLKLEYRKLVSEREKIKKEYREALALRERAKVSILSAQIAQVNARIDLVEEKVERSIIKAPFNGIVVSGDLSQSLGAPVEKGEALFKLSPLGNYRVILNVEDEDISKLTVGEEGSLRLVGLPYDALDISISRIIPISTVANGGNYFRVEAKLTDRNETKLKPGMQGIAKVNVGEENVLWVLSHTLVDRIRLWFWSLGL